jgi:protein SCO1/2
MSLRRREALLAALACGAAPAFGATPTGPVQPAQAAPAFALTDAAGRPATLAALLQGRIGLVQLMFTGCSSVCPAQGFLFAQLAARPRAVEVGWLSISIDALGDDPARLAAWMAKFGAHPDWRAAVPSARDVDRLSQWLRGAPVKPGTHSTQVFVFDAAARLRWRSADHAAPDEIERVIRALAAV